MISALDLDKPEVRDLPLSRHNADTDSRRSCPCVVAFHRTPAADTVLHERVCDRATRESKIEHSEPDRLEW